MCALALLLAGCGSLRAVEPARGGPDQPAESRLRDVSAQQFGADVQRLEGLVAGCAAQASACDESSVGDDERVGDAANGFTLRWGWLRSAMHTAKDAKTADREHAMRDAADHLNELAQQTAATADGSQAAEFSRARVASNNVLRSAEFDGDEGPTWWDRKKAQMYGWLASLFNGVDRLGNMAPWLGRLLEWVLFLGAAAGLVVFLLRTLARQRMRVALDAGRPIVSAWQRDATDWAQQAQGHADASEWREAVHCLYWAAIVLLEGRRAWRHNPTRTPREYVRLLKPGSAQQQGLRGLTRIFERVWYGQHEAGAEEYRRAQAHFRQLEGSSETHDAAPDAAGATA